MSQKSTNGVEWFRKAGIILGACISLGIVSNWAWRTATQPLRQEVRTLAQVGAMRDSMILANISEVRMMQHALVRALRYGAGTRQRQEILDEIEIPAKPRRR